MGINNLLTKIKLYYKILYCILIHLKKKEKRKEKLVILILFNMIDHFDTKNKNYANYC